MIDILRVTCNGKEFIGYRTVTGKRKLMQSVTFNGKTEVDSAQYKANEKDTIMLGFAKLILSQLTTGRSMNR
tara:strand:- start:588 stop:803 length:216 start_codon:yes stop_codon:yes gene_type:complete